MMKIALVAFPLLFSTAFVRSQSAADTSQLKEVVVKAYFRDQPLLRATGSVGIIGSSELRQQAPSSLLPALNTMPGVRMEERSPGSYRLSIRGSLLRSPFGIRNVKVYLDDFMLTDAGGNTYLNLIDASAVGRIEVLRGPEGSVFGANSGGVVLINSGQFNPDSSSISASLTGGSYGLVHQSLSYSKQAHKFSLEANQSYQRVDGYRRNSAMKRKSIQLLPKWNYSPLASLKALFMYSDLNYETPGGLTLSQLQTNPRAARPGTAMTGGAEEQQAAIFNETLFGGISHSIALTDNLKHVVSLTGSKTDFVNPFITTYETRSEKSLGLRTYLELYSKKKPDTWNWQYGLETQRTTSDKRNFVNLKGAPTDKQDFVDFSANQTFLFTRLAVSSQRLSFETALSLNFYKYSFQGLYPVASANETRNLEAQLMPRIALSYAVSPNWVLRSSASRGYSAPTIEEIRPSNRVVNTNLQPEAGWNYEAGTRLSLLANRVFIDAVVFKFKLNDAIVRRVDAADAEFFTNAGGTDQSGIEGQVKFLALPKKNAGVLRGLNLSSSYSFSDFKFIEYKLGASDFSGKRLTGVPEHNLVGTLDVWLPAELNLYIQHNVVTSVPLNDNNTVFANKYQLLQAKLNWTTVFRNTSWKFFFGGDNLLNASYSLGNDLNAFGGRYYNASATRNFYGGLSVSF